MLPNERARLTVHAAGGSDGSRLAAGCSARMNRLTLHGLDAHVGNGDVGARRLSFRLDGDYARRRVSVGDGGSRGESAADVGTKNDAVSAALDSRRSSTRRISVALEPFVNKEAFKEGEWQAFCNRTWKWHSEYADLNWLFIKASYEVGRICSPLLFIMYLVYGEKRFIQHASGDVLPRSFELFLRQYALLFPHVAIVFAISRCGWLLLHQRAFYDTLRYGLLIDFETRKVWHLPQLYILIFYALNACIYFCLKVWQVQGDLRVNEILANEWKLFAYRYALPTIVFFCFFCSTIDIAGDLLPLSKYMQEDPEEAYFALGSTAFMPEDVVRRVVDSGLRFEGLDSSPCQAQDVYREMVDKVCSENEEVGSSFMVRDGCTARQLSESAKVKLGWGSLPFYIVRNLRWSTLAGCWPGTLLLDRRLSDVGSVRFRRYWQVFASISLLLMSPLVAAALYEASQHTHKIMEGDRDYWAALLPILLHASILAAATWGLIGSLRGNMRSVARFSERAEAMLTPRNRDIELQRGRITT